MNYTELFSKAAGLGRSYDFEAVRMRINAEDGLNCGDWDEWADNIWYMLTPAWAPGQFENYGYICTEYPVALLTDKCPDKLRRLLGKLGILYTRLEEPMRCDEEVLKKYVPHKAVFDESFLDRWDCNPDDERYQLVLDRIENGWKRYVDAGCFMFGEIR